ncbi:hypothetical protein [Bacillus cereus]|nr:hypothetical protein [Bacillus cereus]
MRFTKTDRLTVKFIGISFGNTCEFSLQSTSFTFHVELIAMLLP